MSHVVLTYPKCSGEMEPGCVIDRSHAFIFLNQWAKGTPSRNSLLESLFTGQGIKVPKLTDTIPVATSRCQSCGFLESYARDEFAAK